jgi:hypothetical protein
MLVEHEAALMLPVVNIPSRTIIKWTDQNGWNVSHSSILEAYGLAIESAQHDNGFIVHALHCPYRRLSVGRFVQVMHRKDPKEPKRQS